MAPLCQQARRAAVAYKLILPKGPAQPNLSVQCLVSDLDNLIWWASTAAHKVIIDTAIVTSVLNLISQKAGLLGIKRMYLLLWVE